uniref:Uncharacterized protein n=1 Tax=Octopus bimaculoides TaxID=37653 RepID=A0A0L8GVV3_OCTBM
MHGRQLLPLNNKQTFGQYLLQNCCCISGYLNSKNKGGRSWIKSREEQKYVVLGGYCGGSLTNE